MIKGSKEEDEDMREMTTRLVSSALSTNVT